MSPEGLTAEELARCQAMAERAELQSASAEAFAWQLARHRREQIS